MNAPELGGAAVSVVVTDAVDPVAAETTERGLPREVLQDPRSGAVSSDASAEAPTADAGTGAPVPDGAGTGDDAVDDTIDDSVDDAVDDTIDDSVDGAVDDAGADDAEVGGDDDTDQ